MINKLLVLSMLSVLLLSFSGCGEVISPNKDVLTTNSDGELVKIFGPSGFYFDGKGFEKPVCVINGTMKIGGC